MTWRTPTGNRSSEGTIGEFVCGLELGQSVDFSVFCAVECLRFVDQPLEDAGCTDAEMLGHPRGPGPHVRGCWAADLVQSVGIEPVDFVKRSVRA
jgi:hypothetical protein